MNLCFIREQTGPVSLLWLSRLSARVGRPVCSYARDRESSSRKRLEPVDA